MPVREIAALIDHTLLKPQATAADIRRLCQEARRYGFATVCVNPYWVTLAAAELAGSSVRVAAVAGFPLGATTIALKSMEAVGAIMGGALEIDMVLNIGELCGGNLDAVRADCAPHQGDVVRGRPVGRESSGGFDEIRAGLLADGAGGDLLIVGE